jgi:hypothetical protein
LPSHSDSRYDRHDRRHSSSSSSKNKHHRHHSDRRHRHTDSSRVRPAARLHKHSPPLENLTFLSWVHHRLRIPAAQCSQSQVFCLPDASKRVSVFLHYHAAQVSLVEISPQVEQARAAA